MPCGKRIRQGSERWANTSLGIPGRAGQLTQFFSGTLRLAGKMDELLQSCFADFEAELLEIPAFKAILFRTLPGGVPRVKTCRHTFSPPEDAGIQRYVSPPARNTGTFPCTDESR
jgi:hypothetical protein